VTDYDYRNCQSLFGYAAKVHERSGGVCQLCGAGTAGLDFDLWRQMTVEHLIGESQGGYLSQILASLAGRFPGLSAAECAELAAQVDAANTVTACSFCNATTSRAQAPTSMTALIETAPDGTPEDIRRHVIAGLDGILAAKRKEVAWKLASVRKAFDSRVAPGLTEARLDEASEPPATVADSDVRMVAERITSDVAAASGEFVTPPGYAHLSLALVDAVYFHPVTLSGCGARRRGVLRGFRYGLPATRGAERARLPGARPGLPLGPGGDPAWRGAGRPAVRRKPLPHRGSAEGRCVYRGRQAPTGGIRHGYIRSS
jgi:hypothetical protein